MIINRCTMCKCSWELVAQLWSSALTTFGVTWIMPRQVVDLLLFSWGCCGVGRVYGRH